VAARLFSVLISNVDDHLRNHGFLYDTAKRGWASFSSLRPQSDSRDVKPPYLSMFVTKVTARRPSIGHEHGIVLRTDPSGHAANCEGDGRGSFRLA